MADETQDQTPAEAATPAEDATVDAGEMAEAALDGAQQSVDTLAGDAEGGSGGANVDLPSFQQVMADVEASGIDLLHDVDLDVKIELGRTHMFVEDVLRLSEGSVVELDKLAGDPVDVYVNDRLVARGEVLVLNESFCVRVSEIVADADAVTADAQDQADQQATAG